MATTEDSRLGRQSAIDEARFLYQMLGEENTVEELRELIAVPPNIEGVLRAFVKANPEDAWWIERALMFRAAVLEEFNRSVCEGIPAEVAETESGPFTDAMAFAQA